MSLPWRKQLEYRLLRWQARFESSAFDRTAPWVMALILGVVLLLLALARSRELSEEAGLAGAMQTVWLIGGDFTPDASVLAHNYLFEQAGFLIYPVALLASIFPTAITLLVIQSAALALGIVPVWRLARDVVNLRVGTTFALVLVYSTYSAVHTVNIAGFHLEVLALPALIAAVLFGLKGQWVRYSVMVCIVLSARADLGLAIAGLGVLWWIEGRRRAAYLTAIVGLGWAALAILVIQPAYAGGDFPHVEAFSTYGSGNPFSVLWGIVTSPATFLRELFSEANFFTVVSLLAPVLFLPVVAPRYLLPAVPLYALYLVANVPEGSLLEAGQVIPITAFIFVALIFGIAKTGRVIVQKANVDRRLISALVLTAGVFFVRDSVTSPYEQPWLWGRQDGADEARIDAADMIPEEAAAVVRAAPKVLPLLTERVGLFELQLPNDQEPFDVVLADEAAAGVNWIVFDREELPDWDNLKVDQFCFRLAGQGWVPVKRSNGIRLYTFASEAERLGMAVAYADEDETAIC
ncbi:MAG: DUF2079 domain-containing protein [Acidimicrobiales bacterium]